VVADQVRKLWNVAQAAWPAVSWPLEQFQIHLGEHPPRHVEDLYVGGAAGHRMADAWAAIDESYRDMVIRRLQRSARADLEAEDLWSESLARMMRDDPESGNNPSGEPLMHIVRYRGITRLPWHFLAAARTIAIDRHRRRERRPQEVNSEAIVQVSRGDDPAAIAGQQELANMLAQAVIQAFNGLKVEHQFLLAAIYRDGMPKADAGKVAGLSPWQTSRELRKAEEELRLHVQHAIPGQWSPETRTAWDEGWRQCWRQLAHLHPDDDSLSEGAA
jgi:RNA polymerase sigma factor (sigma-70 family)